jgi:hypothetical protein
VKIKEEGQRNEKKKKDKREGDKSFQTPLFSFKLGSKDFERQRSVTSKSEFH